MTAMSGPQWCGFLDVMAGRLLGCKTCKGKTFSLLIAAVQPSGFFIWEDPMMKKKRAQHNAPRCPYCGSHAVLKSADGIYRDNERNTMLYVCSRYPVCDSYVRVHPGTKIPMGTMANRELRTLRNEAHRAFDQLHKRGLMTREDAYRWLASVLGVPMGQAHIGCLGEYYCRRVIEESEKVLNLQKKRTQRKEAGVGHFGGKYSLSDARAVNRDM
jgi:ssDNA-binding Zn-finger/Zn-ribbon topoisomerase 1